ncbi:MAG: HAD family hydrolase [Candidatus Eremiobacteraeota bacterium]|nr:HAD family hydrolase [Candidatus Eremiobacteraeota bacterium]MCW5869501.1 HAD family hydrolase [Candidatus Eremiobacteraeota bacterium]
MASGRPLIFDLDGTLWDSTEVVAQAWNAALAEARLELAALSAADIGSVMGFTHEQIRARLFPELDLDRWNEFSRLAYAREEEFLRRQGAALYPGVPQGLRRLAERHPLGIVSNCQQGYIEVFLEWTGLKTIFQDWECHGNTGLSKGDNIRRLCSRQNWKGALYIGDTAGDEAAAGQAGCDFLFASYGFGQASAEARRLDFFQQLVELVPA